MHLLPGALSERRLRTTLAILASVAIIGSILLAMPRFSALAVEQAGCGTRPLDVELIVDRSRSMYNQQSGGQTRLYWAKLAANQLVDNLDANGGVGATGLHRMGLTTFGGTTASVSLSLGDASADAMHTAIDAIGVNSGTPLKLGLAAGAADLTANARDLQDGVPVTHVIVMLSDGRPDPDPDMRPDASEIASYLASADIAFSVAIGEGGSGPTEIDLDLMMALAKPADAYRHVVEAADLPSLFSDIFTEVACPQIGLEKTADPESLPVGGGSVTYGYTVTNAVAGAPLTNVGVTDDKCSPVAYVSGDTNGDEMLQKGETWLFTCTALLTETTTNVGTASGHFGDATFTATDDATVTVAAPTEEPTTAPTPTATPVATQTPEQTVEAATGTPEPSIPDSALSSSTPTSQGPVLLLALGLLLSLGALARVNVVAGRRRG